MQLSRRNVQHATCKMQRCNVPDAAGKVRKGRCCHRRRHACAGERRGGRGAACVRGAHPAREPQEVRRSIQHTTGTRRRGTTRPPLPFRWRELLCGNFRRCATRHLSSSAFRAPRVARRAAACCARRGRETEARTAQHVTRRAATHATQPGALEKSSATYDARDLSARHMVRRCCSHHAAQRNALTIAREKKLPLIAIGARQACCHLAALPLRPDPT